LKSLSVLIFSTYISSAFACPGFLANHPDECKMHDDYKKLRKEMYQKHGVNVEYLTGYRARRLIEEDKWNESKEENGCHPEKVYDPKPDVWASWEEGAHFLSNLMLDEKLKGKGIKIDRDFMRDLNLHAVKINIMGTLSKLKGSEPGKVREHSLGVPGFVFDCVRDNVKSENVDAVKNFDIFDDNGDPLVGIIGPALGCPGVDTYSGVVSYSYTSSVEGELNKLFKQIGERVTKLSHGSTEQEVSPLEMIADFQRWFVAIHPYGDGNGRTSRFLQDYLMAKMGLPFAPSGMLQDDVLLSKEEYRKLFKDTTMETMDMLKSCRREFEEHGVENPENLSCDCRPMYLESYHPLSDPVTSSTFIGKDSCPEKGDEIYPDEFRNFFFSFVLDGLLNPELIR